MQIWLNSGEKGGVGKTTLARLLASYLNSAGIRWRAIDTDQGYDALKRTGLEQVENIFLYDRGRLVDAEATKLSTAIGKAYEDGVQVLLIDMGGGQLDAVVGLINETGIREMIEIDVKIFFTLMSGFESLETLTKVVTEFDEVRDFSWVIVLNERDGPLKGYLADEVMRPVLLARNAIEIHLPAVYDKAVMQAYAKSGLLLSQYIDRDDVDGPGATLDWGSRARLTKWAGNVYAALDAAGVLPPLDLPPDPVEGGEA